MALTEDQRDLLRRVGRRQQLRKIEQMRRRLAPYLDTGNLTDDDVREAIDVLKTAQDESVEQR